MNKQEYIEHKLEQARKNERAIGDNIIKLLEQLAEAEKPKHRHGDFLMNGWGEDLEEFEIKGAGKALLKVRMACDKKSFILTLYDGSKSSPIVISIPAYEIWCKLGQILMGHKRNQS